MRVSVKSDWMKQEARHKAEEDGTKCKGTCPPTDYSSPDPTPLLVGNYSKPKFNTVLTGDGDLKHTHNYSLFLFTSPPLSPVCVYVCLFVF